MSLEMKEEMEDLMKRRVRELESINVIYKYDCCEDYQPVLLDRYPMSAKIITKCRQCGKGTYLSIVEPMELQILDKIYTIKELEDCAIDKNHYQYRYLKMHMDNFE